MNLNGILFMVIHGDTLINNRIRPPKGQVGGSNPPRDANIINRLKNET